MDRSSTVWLAIVLAAAVTAVAGVPATREHAVTPFYMHNPGAHPPWQTLDSELVDIALEGNQDQSGPGEDEGSDNTPMEDVLAPDAELDDAIQQMMEQELPYGEDSDSDDWPVLEQQSRLQRTAPSFVQRRHLESADLERFPVVLNDVDPPQHIPHRRSLSLSRARNAPTRPSVDDNIYR